ncbi:MAG: transcriptional regulator [Burkholderiales bacterium PBB4]|nr:MAG: transcriptional regulator [Burkholderiales bacterium PBB4]
MDVSRSAHTGVTAGALLARNVVRLRQTKGWTQAQFAVVSHIDRSVIATIERGTRNVSLEVVDRLASAGEVPVARLFIELP